MSAGNNAESSNRQSCAACKHQRRKCVSDCVMARYFPADKFVEFRATLKTFGINNMTKMLNNLEQDEDRKKAVESFVWEGLAWKEDTIQGPLGLYKRLEKENELLRNQQNQQKIVPYVNESGLIEFNQCNNAVTVASQVNSYTNILQGEESVSRGRGILIGQPNLLSKPEQGVYSHPILQGQRISQGRAHADFYNNVPHNGGNIALHGREPNFSQPIMQPNFSQAQQRLSYGRDCNARSYSNFVPVQARTDLPYHEPRRGQGIEDIFAFQQQTMNTNQNHTKLDKFDQVEYEDNGGFNFGQK